MRKALLANTRGTGLTMPDKITIQGAAVKGRLTSLDAVRGIAACTVILSHCYGAIILGHQFAQFDQSLWSIPLRPLHNGAAAVIIFFVLSGYVLALPYFRGTQSSYPRYLIKRFCRIYIPFAAAIFLSAFLYSSTTRQPVANASEWFNGIWPSAWPGTSVFVNHFLMLGTAQDMTLDPVIWSLVHEMRISVLFPLLIIMCRDTRLAVAAALVLLVASTKMLAAFGQNVGQSAHPALAANLHITFLWTAQIVPYFITGILLSKHHEEITALWARVGNPVRICVIVAPVIAFSVSHGFMSAKKDAFYDLGAAIVIVLALEVPTLTAFLNNPIPQWLGRISYSIYLIHLPIMLVLIPVLIGRVPLGFVVAAVMAASLAAATLMHILVEAPAIRLGQQVTRRVTTPITSASSAA
jgi:peptidoglycan/LPS O-acetylase OafA/YrhL